MSDLIVVMFDKIEEAEEARESIRKLEKLGKVSLGDAEVISKGEDGKIVHHGQVDSGTKWGAFGGGFLGLLLAGIFFPVAGIVIGAGLGALLGKTLHLGIDKEFVEEVSESLTPGKSALFVLVKGGDVNMAIAAFRPYEGKILQTTLPTEQVEALEQELKAGD
jgi:uncharacterized membrane protein